eukprot:CAMPEP_0171324640 /NCGR_PEP_ID=MMETSP0816-20121228/116315_1 /TAXON_ID=420281 /ORGANISM="Proboscia inermis, Strain CCAP1064/1" /LENGTH=358 /DNA_ID=CAMNT_0011823627 /DNA_START=45 /DNA_END=1122 /DNA_ORIENTATION=-
MLMAGRAIGATASSSSIGCYLCQTVRSNGISSFVRNSNVLIQVQGVQQPASCTARYFASLPSSSSPTPPLSFSPTKRLTRKQQREAKKAAILSMIAKSSARTADATTATAADVELENDDTSIRCAAALEKRSVERQKLLRIARSLTLSLWRRSLRSVNHMRQGNAHDEESFRTREDEQRKRMMNIQNLSFDDDMSMDVPVDREDELTQKNDEYPDFSFDDDMSMDVPVDREDELRSRADYYIDSGKEQIFEESDCLDDDPWLEISMKQNVSRFLRFLRKGEKQRRWVLKEFKFKDPYVDNSDKERLSNWEEKAWQLLKETHEAKGFELDTENMSLEMKKLLNISVSKQSNLIDNVYGN